MHFDDLNRSFRTGEIEMTVIQRIGHNHGRLSDVRFLGLNSRGGLLQESRDLAALIEERELSTYSSSQCLGSCMIPFLAGKQRLLHSDAQLGFEKSRI